MIMNSSPAYRKIQSFSRHLDNRDTVFLDCGANDGCSAIKYLRTNPRAKILSFEPNPHLSRYHRLLPNTLINCAVSSKDGAVELIIDPFDSDGSTINPLKNVDYHNKLKNQDCPKMFVECIDVASIVKLISAKGAKIDIKLDIEGSEYDVISRLKLCNMLKHISNFYCEFHWDRIGMKESEHIAILNDLNKSLSFPVREWDAYDWMAASHSGIARKQMLSKRRKSIIKLHVTRIFQSIAF